MSDIELIKSKLDIVDVISSYLELKRAGSNFRAICPFHNEKTPSFMVNPGLQIFKCFGCGKGGDVISFIQEIERLEFPEALKIAAAKAGVELKQTDFKRNPKEEEEKKKIIEANTLTAKYYNYVLKTHKSGKAGREYASKRQINSEMIEKYMFGFAPTGFDNLKKFLEAKGFEHKDLVRWGLLVVRSGHVIDKFRERLMQPIFNLNGNIIGFSGRYIGTKEGPPKYLNSPETLVYKKNETLYGLYQGKESIRNKKFVIIVEGNIDVVSSSRVGVGNIVAPLGTAFTQSQVKLLKRFSEEIYFCFDTDEAGIAALIKGLAIAEEFGLGHKVVVVDPFKDADELICKNPKEWTKRVENATETVDYLIKKLSSDLDLGQAGGKTKFRDRILPVLWALKDEVRKQHYVREVSMRLGITDIALNESLLDSKKKISFESVNSKDGKKVQPKINPDRKLEAYLLSLVVQSNSLKGVGLEKDFFADEACRQVFEALNHHEDLSDLTNLHIQLEGEARKVFEDIVLFDTTTIANIDNEIESAFNRVYVKHVRNEVLRIRGQLAQEPENQELLEKLDHLSKELKAIGG